jgi:hypothetical protein
MPYICQKPRLDFVIVTAATAVLRTAGRLLLCYKSRLTRTSTGLVERLGDLPDIQRRIHALPPWVQGFVNLPWRKADSNLYGAFPVSSPDCVSMATLTTGP